MPIALRRTKSLPIWLALIAAIAGIAAVAAVIVTALLPAHRPTDTTAGETERARMQQAMLAQTPSASTSTASADGVTQRDTKSTAAMTPASGSGMEMTDATAAMATASSDNGDGPGTLANGQHLSTDASAAAVPGAAGSVHRSRASASRVVARRKADVARDGNSLRADIARYNAERGADLTAQQLVPLRRAIVPAGHSLWDDVPAPLSDVYRN